MNLSLSGYAICETRPTALLRNGAYFLPCIGRNEDGLPVIHMLVIPIALHPLNEALFGARLFANLELT